MTETNETPNKMIEASDVPEGTKGRPDLSLVPKLIDSEDVPGIERLPEAVVAHDAGTAAVRGADVRPGGRFGMGVITLKEGEFHGDPRRVPGHPSNPATQALEAYSKELRERDQ